MSELFDAALHYATSGWFIFPLAPREKIPITAHGVKDATTDPEVIGRWWAQEPNLNIGLACEPNRVVVIDVDADRGGLETWQSIDTHMKTLTARTGKGGFHFIYRAPEAVDIRNGVDKLGKGIDIRANGGYVVLPPSIHPNGNKYQWLVRDTLAELPPALLERLTQQAQPRNHAPRLSGNGNANSAYARAAFEDQLAALRAAVNGTRNDTLNRAAFALGPLVGTGELERSEVEAALYDTALGIGLGEREARATIRSGLEAGTQEPRSTPDPVGPHAPDASATSLDVMTSTVNPGSAWPSMLEIMTAFSRGETGDAELLARLYADRIVYDHAESAWYLWHNHFWVPDRTHAVGHFVANDVAAQFLYAAAEKKRAGAVELAESLSKRAGSLRNRGKIQNVLALAASLADLALTGDEWDADPMLLAVANGVIDLETGRLRAGTASDYIQTVSPTQWQGLDAPAPRWESSLTEIFAGDGELIAFAQRLFGYGITGLTTEHRFPVLHGEGRNGKGVFIESIAHTLGACASPVRAEVVVSTDRNPNSATPYLYALRGKRICWVSETSEGALLNAGQVKWLTGGDTITARPLYGAPVTFSPTHLLALITNHRPRADADDFALWQRVLLIPFTEAFVDDPRQSHEHQRDPHLKETLQSEAPGILAWLVRGCLEWQRVGLKAPQVVNAATDEYRNDEDILGLFILEKCIVQPGAQVKAEAVYDAYADWAKARGSFPMGGTKFGKRFGKRFKKHKSGGMIYEGVSLLV